MCCGRTNNRSKRRNQHSTMPTIHDICAYLVIWLSRMSDVSFLYYLLFDGITTWWLHFMKYFERVKTSTKFSFHLFVLYVFFSSFDLSIFPTSTQLKQFFFKWKLITIHIWIRQTVEELTISRHEPNDHNWNIKYLKMGRIWMIFFSTK